MARSQLRQTTGRTFLGALGGGITLFLAGCTNSTDQQHASTTPAWAGLADYTSRGPGTDTPKPA